MSTLSGPDLTPLRTARLRRAALNLRDRRFNRGLRIFALTGGSLLFITLLWIVIQAILGANQSFTKYGFSFLGHTNWIPSNGIFGAGAFIYGSIVTAVASTFLATVIGVSIGLFLALLAPRRIAAVVGPLVELLAAVPSVIIGLIGIVVICPFIASTLEPPLHSVLGWTGLFGTPQNSGNSLFAGILVLTIMVVPIIAALSRDLFATVPIELRDGAEALGATRWEMIRAVVLPTTRQGVVAAVLLGFGRAVGEAIAVEQVIGGGYTVNHDLFQNGNTMAATLATQFENPQSKLEISSLYYIALILLIIVIIVILTARWIAGDFKSTEGAGANGGGMSIFRRLSAARSGVGLFASDIPDARAQMANEDTL